MTTITPIFIECCKDKVYGPKVYVNLNHIVLVEKHLKFIPDEQWYSITTVNGEKLFTLYGFASHVSYTLPNF